MVLPKGHNITVNNLSLPPTLPPTGPRIETQDKYLEPIAWIINPAVTGRIPDFADKLARGEDISMIHRFAARPEPDELLLEDQVRWKELTGSELGEDVYMVGTTFITHDVILPRQTLRSIFQALLKKRAEFPEPPFPWLFRLDPYHLTPTECEEELVGRLEKRAVALKKLLCSEQTEKSVAEIAAIQKTLLRDLEAAGVFDHKYSKQKQLWLEKWGYETLLTYHKDAMRFLNHFQSQLQPPMSQNGVPWPALRVSILRDEPLRLQYA
jgi:hypothetical protein